MVHIRQATVALLAAFPLPITARSETGLLSSIGLHWLDSLVIISYFIAIVAIGLLTSRKIHNEDDFFMGGRNLGKIFQIFMNFGIASSSDTSVGAARETFREGLAGIWLKLFVLFVTPFYWFTAVWIRRLRLTSMADIWKIRYASTSMEKYYTLIGLLKFMILISVSLLALQKTIEGIVIKPESNLTAVEASYVENFRNLNELRALAENSPLSEDQKNELQKLETLHSQGKVKGQITSVNPQFLLPAISLIVALYAIAGGIRAAAITDVLQGFLLLVLTVLLLPAGLIEIGGFTGLHASVPESFFDLFGTATTSEYPWYYVAIISLVALCGGQANPFHTQITGSASDENAARIGGVYGAFLKRFSIVIWGFTGIVGYGLYKSHIADPDMLWGVMTRELLGPGLIGLMIVCLLAALMSSADAFIISSAALFTQNIYKPIRPERSEREYLWVGRITGLVVIAGSTLIALMFNNILFVIKFGWSVGLIFGPVYWMQILWRRSNAKGAWTALLFTSFSVLVFGYYAENMKFISTSAYFTQETNEKTLVIEARATAVDVESGTANREGQVINKSHWVKPTGIFFDVVELEDPDNPDSPKRGKGQFRTSLIFPAMLGVNFSNWSKAQLSSLSYLLDVLIPFLLIIVVSRFTRMHDADMLDQWYGRLHTPVRGDAEMDAREMALTQANPNRFQDRNLFKSTYIELQKPTLRNVLGFVTAWVFVFLIIGLLVLLSSIGR